MGLRDRYDSGYDHGYHDAKYRSNRIISYIPYDAEGYRLEGVAMGVVLLPCIYFGGIYIYYNMLLSLELSLWLMVFAPFWPIQAVLYLIMSLMWNQYTDFIKWIF